MVARELLTFGNDNQLFPIFSIFGKGEINSQKCQVHVPQMYILQTVGETQTGRNAGNLCYIISK